MPSRPPRHPAPAGRTGLSIAAVLIARNEARCITRCLDSVRPWVDRILVVDTGSSDDTVDLARRAGAEVHTLAWPDDFSIARNHALTLADADWNLVIDADEWITSGGALLRPWCAGPPRLGRVCLHNESDNAQGLAPGGPLPSSRNWMSRLLPRGVRYEGRIHEQPASPLPRERLELHLGHDGYLAPQLATKRGRNQALLTAELRDHPGDPYILYQLGKEAEGRDEFPAAADMYARARDLAPADANWRHEALVRHLHCLGSCGRLDEALEIAGRHMEMWADSPDFFFVLGNLLLNRAMADPGQAVAHWLPLACAAWERCLEIGEQPALEGSVSGRGSHLAQHNLDIVRAQLAALAA